MPPHRCGGNNLKSHVRSTQGSDGDMVKTKEILSMIAFVFIISILPSPELFAEQCGLLISSFNR